MRRNIFFAFIAIFWLLWGVEARALSQYGRACEYNKSCVKCKEDVKCLQCMQNCYNMYGEADTKVGEKMSRDEFCRKNQGKWCYAQCWDPDDTKAEDYVSTKPVCSRAY